LACEGLSTLATSQESVLQLKHGLLALEEAPGPPDGSGNLFQALVAKAEGGLGGTSLKGKKRGGRPRPRRFFFEGVNETTKSSTKERIVGQQIRKKI